MEYLIFSMWFTIIHTAAYMIAGVIALHLSKDLYTEKTRLLDYLRDMSDKAESQHVQRYFIIGQLLRGLLMSIVLYPILGLLGEISFLLRFAFLSGLMIIYADFGCAVPFNNNIEGFIYMKERYLKRNIFWKLYLETIIYSLLFGGLVGWLLF